MEVKSEFLGTITLILRLITEKFKTRTEKTNAKLGNLREERENSKGVSKGIIFLEAMKLMHAYEQKKSSSSNM